ncbi:hypothetical protein Taro_039342 [Colocasia esculenta]|uniref:Uncharacterized protein n=1 Tax=Colocasia esculenta TaxID=4460 RepID=A0A843WR95_COLES|nr:hypothetical protein [Colocasia esculenta]
MGFASGPMSGQMLVRPLWPYIQEALAKAILQPMAVAKVEPVAPGEPGATVTTRPPRPSPGVPRVTPPPMDPKIRKGYKSSQRSLSLLLTTTRRHSRLRNPPDTELPRRRAPSLRKSQVKAQVQEERCSP